MLEVLEPRCLLAGVAPSGSGLFTDSEQLLGEHNSRAVALGDLDGDGDLDAFVANSAGEGNRVWLNQAGQFTDSGQVLGSHDSNDVALGDLDGDGDLDAFVANDLDANRIWLNDGGVFQNSGQYLGRQHGNGVALGDLDGDGDLDAVVANRRQPNRIWLNDGTAFVDSGQHLGNDYSRSLSLGDLDGDGDLDMFVANYAEGNRVWLNVAGSFHDSGQLLGEGNSWDVSLGDLDQDGDLDAFVANRFQGNRVWFNHNGEFSDSGQSLGHHSSFGVALGDLDADGDLDAFVANFRGNRVWRNEDGVFVDSGQALGSHSTFDVALGDVDADGDLDAFAANYSLSFHNRIWLGLGDPHDDESPRLMVLSLTTTDSGFVAHFNHELDTSALNLYDTQSAGLGAPDVVLEGMTSGPVTGSLIVHPSRQSVTFLKTGGPLVADTYSVTLRSAADGFKDLSGNLLDGDGNGIAADDFRSSFTIAEPPNDAISIGVPDFVRGPNQPVNLSGSSGIPLTISDGTNVRVIHLRLRYDATLLTITGATVGPGMSPRATVKLDSTTPGLAILTFISPTDLADGTNRFLHLQASVPSTELVAVYGSQGILDVQAVAVTDSGGNPLPATDDDALHVSSYFGDVSGDGGINATDASQVARVAAYLDTGFAAYPLTDPMVLGDISGNGLVNATDASMIARSAVLIPVPEIPSIPSGFVVAANRGVGPGLDVFLTLPSVAPRSWWADDWARQPATVPAATRFERPPELFVDEIRYRDVEAVTPISQFPSIFESDLGLPLGPEAAVDALLSLRWDAIRSS